MIALWSRFKCSYLTALFLISASVFAGVGTEEQMMPIKTTGAPAIDLVYGGKPIDRDEATDLVKHGVDLSTLDPLPSDPWQPTPLSFSNAEKFNYPPNGSQVDFKNDISPKGNYRGQVEYNGSPFRIVIDMDSHQYLMNAAMLRKLGYPVDMPKRYQRLQLRFTTLDEMKNFIENFAFETGFSRDRWLVSVDEKNLTVSLKDVNLEYPRIDVQQLYDGKFDTDWIAGRRAMRALIIPLMLLDIRLSEDSINIFPWEFSRILAEHIVLKHPDVQWFKETTYEDARWIARKIANLSKDDLRSIVAEAKFPEDISAILLEKITARRNHMVKMFSLGSELASSLEKLPYTPNLTIGEVKKGKVLQEYYPDYAQRFTVGDPDSPLRWNELRHYVRMEAIAQGIRVITDKVNKELQVFTTTKGIENHKQNFLDAIMNHFKDHPNEPYVVPLKPWFQPLGGFNVNASRSLVTGTYYGSDSNKAQLVDNFTVGAGLGTFGGIDGNTHLQNVGFSASVNYQRTYTHVRPLVASLEEVKKEKWKSLFVPGFMRSTSKVLSWKNIKKKFDLFREKYYEAQAKWIKELPAATDAYKKKAEAYEALKTRTCTARGYRPPFEECVRLAKLFPKQFPGIYPEPAPPTPIDTRELYLSIIGHPLPDEKELPPFIEETIDPSESGGDPAVATRGKPSKLPDGLEDPEVVRILTDFLDDIRDNEVFTITDSFVNQVSPQVQIPLTTFIGMGAVDLLGSALFNKISPSVGVSVTGEWAVVKRLMFMRKGDQFEIYDNKMNTRALGAGMNFSAWIQLAKVAAQKKTGVANTDALMLDLSSITDKEKSGDEKLAKDRKKLLLALADLFMKNEIDTAEEVAPSYAIRHDLTGKSRNAKVLMWNWATYAETNKVKIKPPVDLLNRYDAEKEARTLFSARKMNLDGKSPYGLVGQVLSKAVGVNGLLDGGGNLNPSGTFLGSSNWSQVRAEAEITDGRDFKPTLTFEDHYGGWYLKKDKLLRILDRFQAEVNDLNLGSAIFRRDAFLSTEVLQAYDIRSSVVLYPSGVKKLQDILLKPTSRQGLLLSLLDMMDQEDYRKRCRKYFEKKGIEPELEEFEKLSSEDGRRVWNRCIEPWMRKVMRHVRRVPKPNEKQKTIEWLSDTMSILDKHVGLSRFLGEIGKENFFMQIKVSGFRTKDENGDRGNVEDGYVTDTIGSIQTPLSLGAFRDFNVYTNGIEWKISDYELQARYFGDGL